MVNQKPNAWDKRIAWKINLVVSRSRKYPTPHHSLLPALNPHRESLEILRGRRGVIEKSKGVEGLKSQNFLKENKKLDWGFQRCGEGGSNHRKLHWGSMDIFGTKLYKTSTASTGSLIRVCPTHPGVHL